MSDCGFSGSDWEDHRPQLPPATHEMSADFFLALVPACGKDHGAKGSGQGQKKGHGPGTFCKEHSRQLNASVGRPYMATLS